MSDLSDEWMQRPAEVKSATVLPVAAGKFLGVVVAADDLMQWQPFNNRGSVGYA